MQTSRSRESDRHPTMFENAHNFNIHDGTFVNVQGNMINNQYNARELDVARLQEAFTIMSSEISIWRSRNIQSKQELLYHKIIRWLSPLQFRQRQRDIFARRVQGTGEWLLNSKEYKAWRRGYTTPVLWCPGKPGAGKTILSSVVINHLQSRTRNTGDALMFIFCDYKERREQTYANLITSLLSQLLEERCERMGDSEDRFMVSEHVKKLYERHTRRKTRPSNEEFLEVLRIEISKFYSSAFIVLDALDEGPEDERTRNSLVFDLRNLGDAVRLLVTSRNLPPIARLMDGVPRLPIQARVDDIQKYIESQLSTTPRLWRLLEGNSELRNILIPTLSGNCSGMFLVVKLHMDALAKQNNVTAIRNALVNLPQGVDAIYDDIISRIRAQAEPDKHLAETTLAWVAYGRRPLSVTELRCALSENKETSSLPDLEIIVSACAGIIVVDEGSQNVRFIHQTVQEYFDRNQTSRFPLVHDELARKCIEYLSATCSQGPRRRMIHLLDRMEQHPLLDYAANNWGWHVRASKDQKMLLAMTVDFMQNNSLFGAASQIVLRKERIHRWIGYSMWHATTYFDLHAVALHFLKCGILPDAEGLHEHLLFYAVRHQSVGVLKVLIQHKFDVNTTVDSDGRTPLSRAVVSERGLEIVRFLLAQQEIDVNSKAKDRRTPFSYAVEGGSVEIVELLLAREDVDINLKDEKGRTPFSYAVRRRTVEIVKLLIAREDVDVNSENNYGWTPLLDAIWEGSVEIVKLLLAREDVHVNSMRRFGQTPFSYAVERGSDEIVKLLLAREDVDVKSKDRNGRTPLSHAVGSWNVEIVELLLMREDGDINLKDENGRTPFSHAVERGSVKIIKLLLAREDVDVKSKDMNGRTPFSYAMKRGNASIVELLLAREDVDVNLEDKNGQLHFPYNDSQVSVTIVEKLLLARGEVDINLRDQTGRTLFSHAVGGGSVKIVEPLLAREDVDVNSKDEDGRTAFSYAVEAGSVNIVKLLLAREDIDINSKDENGRTPFSYAVEVGSVDIVKLLLAREDIDVNSKASDRRTPFSYAVEAGSLEIVKLLLVREDVDINSKDKYGWIPLSYAVERPVKPVRRGSFEGRSVKRWSAKRQSVEIVELLLAREGVDINSKDKNGRTLLSYAVERQSIKIVELLLAREDVEVNSKDRNGRTPFSYAVERWSVEIVELLLAREDFDVNSKDKNRRTPFSYAVEGWNIKIVELLLAREDVDINSKDKNGRTPFSYAIQRLGGVEIIKLLLAREDIVINSKDENGRTPFSYAVEAGNVDIVKLLLMQENVDVNLKNKYGRTPLWYAINSSHYNSSEILELLLSHPRIKVDIRDKLGRTPLSDAAAHGNVEVVELLLAHGAAVNKRDYFGLTPRLRTQYRLQGEAKQVIVSLLDAFQHR